ncbi:TPR repeat [Variovorax sp. OV329]|nr:TPR repeat [Variovorax sp. OV329]
MNSSDSQTSKEPLPRHQALKTFDPHRKDFTCKYEANAAPPIDPEAEAWNQEALYVTRYALWQNQKDWKKAEALWIKAAQRKHWKAMMNLASLYEKGEGESAYQGQALSVVKADPDRAVTIVEEAMRLGIPAAYDKMGNYHANGTGGIRISGSRAWAFWQMAADMGNPQALTHIGKATAATYDNPEEGFWGNMPIAIQMLECAFGQGFGQAALELGVVLDVGGRDPSRALFVLHEGVKMGSERAAKYLGSSFRHGDSLVRGSKDQAREERYDALGDALYHNPDLRFPNLDKVVPLPPAKLPSWDMSQPQTLVDAAKGLVPAPAVKPTPGSQRTGRAHIPQGYALPERAVVPASEWRDPDRSHTAYAVAPEREGAAVPFSGYWIARLNESHREFQFAWNEGQVPQRYARAETFAFVNKQELDWAPPQGVSWHYLGTPVKLPDPPVHDLARRGVARLTRLPEGPRLDCWGSKPCPRTGVWVGLLVNREHPLFKVFDRLDRQAYVQEGQAFPDPRTLGLDVAREEVQWLWLDNANQPGPSGTRITLSDLHDDEGSAKG